ncbi:MAG: hypothetical protein ABJL57_19570 [Hyphomonas sp.]|uniref:hypothetical protein n=1 Tax=Hyphomonas sp. TaxID=87 RepID=UPI00326610F7
MDDDSQNAFKVWFDPHIKNLIHATFSYMAENYHMTGVIDHAAWVIQEGELESLLPTFAPRAQAARYTSFSSKDYDRFVRLIDYAGYAAPKQEDRALLELIHECFLDSGRGNNRIYALMMFAPDSLAALVSVFGKIIDDPGAIDNSMYDLTAWPKFVDLTNRLKTIEATSDRQILVPMTFGEWATYSAYLNHVFDLDEEDLTSGETAEIDKLLAETGAILLLHTRDGE